VDGQDEGASGAQGAFVVRGEEDIDPVPGRCAGEGDVVPPGGRALREHPQRRRGGHGPGVGPLVPVDDDLVGGPEEGHAFEEIPEEAADARDAPPQQFASVDADAHGTVMRDEG